MYPQIGTLSVISEDAIFSKLEVKGISRYDIQKMHLSPQQNQIFWFITVEKGDKRYYFRFDGKTGDIEEEKMFNVTRSLLRE